MAVTVVQQATGTVTAGTSATATFGATPTEGNVIVVFWNTNGPNYADTVSCTNVTGFNARGGAQEIHATCGFHVGTAGASAGTVVTVTWVGNETGEISAVEFSGAAHILDGTGIATNNLIGTSIGISSLGTGSATNVLMLAVSSWATTAAVTSGPTNGFTSLTGVSNATAPASRMQPSYKVALGNTVQTNTYGWSGSTDASATLQQIKTSDIVIRTQDLRITGVDFTNRTQDFRATGQDISTRTQDLRIIAQDFTNRTQDMRIFGHPFSNITQDFRATGQDFSFRLQEMRIIGQRIPRSAVVCFDPFGII